MKKSIKELQNDKKNQKLNHKQLSMVCGGKIGDDLDDEVFAVQIKILDGA